MQDDILLTKLITLRALKPADRNEYIDNWINDTKLSVKSKIDATVGVGDGIAAITKLIKTNKKEHPDCAGVLKTSKGNKYIVTNKSFGILLRDSFDLPMADNKQIADIVLNRIHESSENNREEVVVPTRAELEYIIKLHKSSDKATRSKYPEYDFGKGLPKFNAAYLSTMVSVFQTNVAYIDKSKGPTSSIYFECKPIEGILMPILK